MGLDAGTVDEQPVGRILGVGECAEDALPDAALGPANEAVVERLLGSIDIRAVRPATAAAKRMDDPAQHPAVVNALLAAHVGRQKRLDPRPLLIRKPKEIRHLTASIQKAVNHISAAS